LQGEENGEGDEHEGGNDADGEDEVCVCARLACAGPPASAERFSTIFIFARRLAGGWRW